MKKLPISGFIIAKNEEVRIPDAIKSMASLVDDLYVIDSGSTDNTVRVAEELGAKVIFNEWPGYLSQKVFGEKLCKHDWILNLDADEELTPELFDEIFYIFSTGQQDKYKAYRFDRVTLHRNDKKLRSFGPLMNHIRLYNKNYASFGVNDAEVHDEVLLNDKTAPWEGDVLNLSSPAKHLTIISIEHMVTKFNFYSSEQARDMLTRGKRPSLLRLFVEFPWYFFKAFFLRRHFVYGIDGFVDSVVIAFFRFLKIAKARDAFLKRQREES